MTAMTTARPTKVRASPPPPAEAGPAWSEPPSSLRGVFSPVGAASASEAWNSVMNAAIAAESTRFIREGPTESEGTQFPYRCGGAEALGAHAVADLGDG